MAADFTDIVLIGLLFASIAYGFLISRKVKQLIQFLKELEPLINEYSDVVERSEASLSQLKTKLESDPFGGEQRQEDLLFTGAEVFQTEKSPTFATRRAPRETGPGVQVVRHKKDLVRQFFHSAQAVRKLKP